ncbi:MAG: hypothetical protein EA381_16820 [Planctomycetaceae bacterium]|nr:MAG: hypothetical protein EA381_16820 [Planctomycetaceae bacterium]
MFPYFTIDVFLVAMAFAMPLGVLAAAHVSGRVSNSLALLAGFGLVGLSIVVLAMLNHAVDSGSYEASGMAVGVFGGGAALRSVLAILFWVGCVLAAVSIFTGSLKPLLSHVARQSDVVTFVAAAVATLLMPSLYVQVRCENGWKRFEELNESTRIGEARAELLTILRLAPNSSWRGRSVTESFREVQAEYDRIEQARKQLPHPPGDPETALQQTRFLAILGETELALSYLAQFPEASQSADAALLRATIHETRRDWRDAIEEYVLSQQLLTADGEAVKNSERWQTALRGEGFCRRKAGDLDGAERAYLKLMSSAPEANHALLLAYFYEDTQKTSDAQRWLQETVRLEPAYGEEAERLWAKLTTSHFGCFQAYRQKSQPTLTVPPASSATR